MGDVKIRRLDDWVIVAHRAHADQAGRSLEEELRLQLTEIAARRRNALISDIDQSRNEIRSEHGTLSDSAESLRADRDARG